MLRSPALAPPIKAERLRDPTTAFPYYNFIVQTQSGFVSNYNALQATLTSRNYHGLSFIASYTLAHALDDWTKNSQATAALANPTNPQYQYGNSDFDVRNRFRFSPVYAIPGTKKVALSDGGRLADQRHLGFAKWLCLGSKRSDHERLGRHW